MRFVPVNLGEPDSTIGQAHLRHTFELTPSAPAVHPAQPCDVPDPVADRYGLDIGDLTNNLDVHRDRLQTFSRLLLHPVEPGEYAGSVPPVAAGPGRFFQVPDEVLERVGGPVAGAVGRGHQVERLVDAFFGHAFYLGPDLLYSRRLFGQVAHDR